MADTRDTWRNNTFGVIGAGLYDAVVEREQLARPAGRVLWGTDVDLFYDSMNFLAELPDDTSVLDVPCGGGVALRALRPDQKVHYIAADIAPAMLDRTRARAAHLGLTTFTCTEADIEALPFPDNSFDICISYNGLHCLPDPAAALRDIARCLKPGGRLVGTAIIRGTGRRSELFQLTMRTSGVFGPSGTRDDYDTWMATAGLHPERLETSGALLHIAAVKPALT
ncbi:class I SAM-dependent methyltransferase [Nocardia crassostreae]|uniref:class I SAM-dependent methyltransferase n=1 Tax=Nocardia crassostreae TaxID=53428 RepID=UPI00083394C5|nr:class I SAM-dependent methyltransferase [Nocardia crassostreae]